jgi:hypothetical protein
MGCLGPCIVTMWSTETCMHIVFVCLTGGSMARCVSQSCTAVPHTFNKGFSVGLTV